LSDKEFSLYEEEEKIINKANEFIDPSNESDLEEVRRQFSELLGNYKKLFKQSKRLIRMSDKMEAELAITKVELEKYSKKLKVQATTDPLTGLANRRKITELLEEGLNEIANNSKDNINIIMLDIDFFKKVNDTYGHPMGDEVIKVISNHMQDAIGKEGIVGRFGGEEFLTIFYNEDIKYVYKLADEIREEIKQKRIGFEEKKISVTVSMGIASSSESLNIGEILDIADKRLYEAKESGRNKVIFN
jgi:diguanylate cyclase (GGDEF)-like protein